MVKSGEKQISISDPDSRSLVVKEGITDVFYNIQSVADSKHSLIVGFDTINTNDTGQLHRMSAEAMETLSVESIQVLADKGYHTGKDLHECSEAHIAPVVAYPERNKKNHRPRLSDIIVQL